MTGLLVPDILKGTAYGKSLEKVAGTVTGKGISYITTKPVEEGIEVYETSYVKPQKRSYNKSDDILTGDNLNGEWGIPQGIKDWWEQIPIIGKAQTYLDHLMFWLGSPEQKAKALGEWLPVSPETYEKYLGIIKEKVEEAPEFWEQPVTPWGQDINIQFPDILGGLKNFLIIGGIALGGIYLLGKAIGGRK